MITRFAPSPTGPLHLGHAYSALLAYDLAKENKGTFLLRVEDTDFARSKLHWEKQIYDDLRWLGLSWPNPVLRQSENLDRYKSALNRLQEMGLLYPCICSRADIRAALLAPQEGDTPILYPRTCRDRSDFADQPVALRLDLEAALGCVDGPLTFTETGVNPGLQTHGAAFLRQNIGDAVLERKDVRTASYALAAVIDDADQGVTHVIRGQDMEEFTFLQVLLQNLLNLPSPTYHHHRLIRDENGKRLAKRDDARALSKYRAEGANPNDIRQMVGLPQVAI